MTFTFVIYVADEAEADVPLAGARRAVDYAIPPRITQRTLR